MKPSTLIVVTLGLLSACSTGLRADTVVSNLSEPAGSYFSGFASDSDAASSFTTDGDPAVLTGANLLLFAQNSPATFDLDLRADDGGMPGTVLGTFGNRPSTSSGTASLLTFNGDFSLTPNTTYWLVVTSLSGAGGWPQANTTDAVGVWTLGGLVYSFDGGATWIGSEPDAANYFSLDATVAPEPSTWALVGLGVVGLGLTLRRRAGRS